MIVRRTQWKGTGLRGLGDVDLTKLYPFQPGDSGDGSSTDVNLLGLYPPLGLALQRSADCNCISGQNCPCGPSAASFTDWLDANSKTVAIAAGVGFGLLFFAKAVGR